MAEIVRTPPPIAVVVFDDEPVALPVQPTTPALEVVVSTTAPRGAPGESAYQAALALGFTGTLDDWLNSLRGEQGVQGVPGAQGPRGVQGPPGVPGTDGAAGADGAPGPQGPQGEPGPEGPPGAEGPMGPQGPRGNTGSPGPQGPAGADGIQGPPGEVGPAGLNWRRNWDADVDYVTDDAVYHDGSSWFASDDPPLGEVPSETSAYWWPLAIHGAVGAQGPQGAQGVQGPAGQPGADGATGPQGPKGDPGPAGPPGADGADGAPGPKGDPGEGVDTRYMGAWDAGTTYEQNDTVSSSGALWRAQFASTNLDPSAALAYEKLGYLDESQASKTFRAAAQPVTLVEAKRIVRMRAAVSGVGAVRVGLSATLPLSGDTTEWLGYVDLPSSSTDITWAEGDLSVPVDVAAGQTVWLVYYSTTSDIGVSATINNSWADANAKMTGLTVDSVYFAYTSGGQLATYSAAYALAAELLASPAPAWIKQFDFQGGGSGRGIETVVRTDGDGSPGTDDTYTITYSDATTSVFTVHNGADGSGDGGVGGHFRGDYAAAIYELARSFDFDAGFGSFVPGDANVTIADYASFGGTDVPSSPAKVAQLYGARSPGSTRSLTIDIADLVPDVQSPARVRYWAAVSSESVSYDYLRLIIGGAEDTSTRRGGTSTIWELIESTVDIPTTGTVQWNYRKDGSGDSGSDSAYIARIEVLQPQGVYYNLGDVVSFNGSMFHCLTPGTLNDPTNTDDWMEMPAGPQGPAGPIGATGPAGPQGEVGPAGPQGEVGPIGPEGPQGEPGDPGGPMGPQGPEGPPGPAGLLENYKGSWDPLTAYLAGDIVTHAGATYIAHTDTSGEQPSIEALPPQIEEFGQAFVDGASIDVPAPDRLVAGDLHVLQVFTASASAAVATPAGWTLRESATYSNSYQYVFTRQATEVDVATWPTLTIPTAGRIQVGVYVISNAQAVNTATGTFGSSYTSGTSLTVDAGETSVATLALYLVSTRNRTDETVLNAYPSLHAITPMTGADQNVSGYSHSTQGAYDLPAIEFSTDGSTLLAGWLQVLPFPAQQPNGAWEVFADKGDTGTFLSTFRREWDEQMSYKAGDLVTYQGRLYLAEGDNQGSAPYTGTQYRDTFNTYPSGPVASIANFVAQGEATSNTASQPRLEITDEANKRIRAYSANGVPMGFVYDSVTPRRSYSWSVRYGGGNAVGFAIIYFGVQNNVAAYPSSGSLSYGYRDQYYNYISGGVPVATYIPVSGDVFNCDVDDWVATVQVLAADGSVRWGPYQITIPDHFHAAHMYGVTGVSSGVYLDRFTFDYQVEDPNWGVVLAPGQSRGLPGPAGPQGVPGYFENHYSGTWDPATAYVGGEIVAYNGGTWLSLLAGTNQPPSEASTYWGVIALKGAQGDTGLQGTIRNSYRGEWASGTNYAPGDVVTQAGATYMALVATSDALSGSDWQVLADKGDTGLQGPQGEPGLNGTGVQVRTTTSVTTGSLAPNSSEDTSVGFQSVGWRLLRIQTDVPARVRLYATPTQRDADRNRAPGTDPTGDHGLLLEYTATDTVMSAALSPQVNGASMEEPPSPDIAARITSLAPAATTVTATFTYVRTE